MAGYLDIVQWVQERIENLDLLPGEKLQSENELSKIFKVSRQTVRHGIGVLEEAGLVNRVQGSGTYINDNRQAALSGRNRIAVVTTYVDGYIFPKTIQGIEQVLSEHGYLVQISFTNNTVERERSILEDIIKRDEVAGIIVEATKSGLPNPNLSLYQEIINRKIPILFINSYYPMLPVPHVAMNDLQTGYLATKYLIQMGHQNIGGIFKLDDGQGHLRYRGYMKAMEEALLPTSDKNIIWVDTEETKNLELSKTKIISRMKGQTAMICYNDQVAFSLIPILREEQIQVPSDISLIGIDDSELSQLGEIPLTSIPHPMDRLGAKAAKNLMKLIKMPTFDATYEFDTQVIERASVLKIETI